MEYHRICLNCQSAYISKRKPDRLKFCSQSCAAIFNNKLRTPQRTKTGKFKALKKCKAKPCKHCSKLTKNSSFCSRKCYNSDSWLQTKLAVEQGKAPTNLVKKYLLEKYGNTCMDSACAWDFAKRYVPVQLDHIDGNSSNNALENCRLLCPGCHTLTPTYGSKNKGNGPIMRRLKYARDKKRFAN